MHLNPGEPAGKVPLRPIADPVLRSGFRQAWKVVARLPLPAGGNSQPGVAGPFAGISGNALIVAGGSNFPGKMPWDGGRKAYVDDIYILEKDQGFHWYTARSLRLPQKIAYGASVTVPEGVVCIGGETPAGFSKQVFLLTWDGARRELRFKGLPDLPVALANAGSALIGHTVYIAGGENADHALAGLFSLDLDSPAEWRRLPDLPIAISHSAAVAQGGLLYLVGGRTKTASGISTLHNTVFRYDPAAGSWRQLASIGNGGRPPHLAAANAVADDNGGILVIGGDDGRLFHKLETINSQLATSADDRLKRQLRDRKLRIIETHPGFWRGILRYEPSKDQWTKLADLPVPAPVTTTAVRWGDAIVIPCGELKPGLRSSDILMADVIDVGATTTGTKAIPKQSPQP